MEGKEGALQRERTVSLGQSRWECWQDNGPGGACRENTDMVSESSAIVAKGIGIRNHGRKVINVNPSWWTLKHLLKRSNNLVRITTSA